MNECTFRKLDEDILRRISHPSALTNEHLTNINFLLFSALKPLRVSLWKDGGKGGPLISSYGTQNDQFHNPKAFITELMKLQSERGTRCSVCSLEPETASSFLATARHVAVASSAESGGLILVFEFDAVTPPQSDFEQFLTRMHLYLQLLSTKIQTKIVTGNSKELQNAFRELPVPTVLLDEKLKIVTCSESFANLFDTRNAGIAFFNFLEERQRTDFKLAARQAVASATKQQFSATLQLAGRYTRQELSLAPTGTGSIVVQLHCAAPAATTSSIEHEQLALFTTLNPFPVIQFSLQGKILSANPAAQRTFATEENAFVSLLIPQYTNEELRTCIEKGSIISKCSIIKNKTFQFVARGAPGLGYGILYGVDVTERVLAEEKLASNRNFLRKIIDANPNLIFVKDADGRFTLANQTVADIYRTTIDEIVGKTDGDLNGKSDEVESFRKDDLEVIHHQRELTINEEKVTDANGNTRWLQTVKKPIRTLDDEIHVLGVATDITDLKNLQLQLLQSQKMEAVGQLAGGIAHDFNNLLTGILGYTNLLLLDEGDDSRVQHSAQMIEKAAMQASQLTQKLLGFARKGKHQNVAVNIHDTVKEVTQLLKRTVEENIQITLQLDSYSALVMGDPVQMQQIVLNLVINARDAIQLHSVQNGHIDITTSFIDKERTDQLSLPSLQRRNYLKLSIKDTGCGIPKRELTKIFEPFFTTKDPSKGTGMGLAMVYGIVENHEGTIHVESSVGKGSTFSVYLPVTPEAQEPVARDVTPSVQGKGQILLVDDHSMILDVTSQMLGNLGYEVVTAENGMKALEYYKRHSYKIDLVILDMIMPKMGARECFQRFKSINPDVRVVLSTGYVNNNRVQEIMNEGMAGFVQKPYHLYELSKVVADALRPTH